MNIKMIVCDLDGTLLRSDKSVSPRTQAVLTQCKAMGIKLVYATGRGDEDGMAKWILKRHLLAKSVFS